MLRRSEEMEWDGIQPSCGQCPSSPCAGQKEEPLKKEVRTAAHLTGERWGWAAVVGSGVAGMELWGAHLTQAFLGWHICSEWKFALQIKSSPSLMLLSGFGLVFGVCRAGAATGGWCWWGVRPGRNFQDLENIALWCGVWPEWKTHQGMYLRFTKIWVLI